MKQKTLFIILENFQLPERAPLIENKTEKGKDCTKIQYSFFENK